MRLPRSLFELEHDGFGAISDYIFPQGEFRDGETAGAGQRKWASGHYYIGEEEVRIKQ
jgi:hypothetical protein